MVRWHGIVTDLIIQSVVIGGLAQMVERSLSMREVPGSIPGFSIFLFALFPLLGIDTWVLLLPVIISEPLV